MKCKNCRGRMAQLWKSLNYTINDKEYKVTNLPVRVCEKCNNEYIDEITMETLNRFANIVKGNEIDYRKMKDDEDSAAAAACSIVVM